ncbi:hypothetical protein pdam_00019920, partial [Pocillopora damicornis]
MRYRYDLQLWTFLFDNFNFPTSNRKGICNLTYGTDGETPLETGFEKVFPIHGTSSSDTNIHLRYYNHLEVDPLQWTQMTSQQRDAKIKKVFGCILPSRRRDEAITRKLSIGLVDGGLCPHVLVVAEK